MDTFDIRFLHEGSNLKLVEVCLLLLAFKNRFTLNNLCFECLLVLIHFFTVWEQITNKFEKTSKSNID